jgi:hypothetical protein
MVREYGVIIMGTRADFEFEGRPAEAVETDI